MEENMRELIDILAGTPKEVASEALIRATAFTQGYVAGRSAEPEKPDEPEKKPA